MRKWRSALILMLAGAGAWSIASAGYIHAKAWLAQQLIADAWSRTLAGERQVKPWPWADTWPVARLRAPTLGADLYVLADASGRSLAFGPGLMTDASDIGERGNAIIAAHRDTHFTFLRDASVGVEFVIQRADGRDHRFRLIETHVLDASRQALEVASSAPTLSLLTCYPFEAVVAGGPMRYVAVAEKI